MKSLSGFSFVLCLIVFIVLVSISIFLICFIVRMMIKLIRAGAEDDWIIKENKKLKKKKKYFNVFSFLFYSALIAIVGASIYINIASRNKDINVPTCRVVISGSMSKKHEVNKYLETNNLNNQFDVFDLIITHQMPDEYDIKLYDVIVYKIDDNFVIHRVVKIEEPNKEHPDGRLFYFKGDALKTRDKEPVTYDQMYGIYLNERVPKVGSFIVFLQSPMGIIVIILSIFAMLVLPFIERKIDKAYEERFAVLRGTIRPIDVKSLRNTLENLKKD